MSIQKSEAIVLRRQDLRETSVCLTLYTRWFGKIRGIVRGVRGARAMAGGGALELFALDEIVFYERARGDLYTVSQCDLVEYFIPVRSSLEKLAYASYIVELLDSVTGVGDAQEEAFNLLLASLRLLATESSARRVARIFEIRLLAILGLMPTLGVCVECQAAVASDARFSIRLGGVVCPACRGGDAGAYPVLAGTVRFMERIRSLPLEMVARIKVSEQVGREVERLLRKYLDYHIERRLKTVDFIKAIAEP